jgi:tRNA nucleotidyltransferase (CCA-adding enzyme)
VSLEARVLDRIRPTPDEERRLRNVVKEVLARLETILKEKGWDAKPRVCGSAARGTHLTGADVDVFVLFPPDLPREELERRGLFLGTILSKPLRMYAEHPYTRGLYDDVQVEIVPCYRISDASQRMSAVDRTPLHVDYILGHLNPTQADEVRLLKAWLYGLGIYGAESKVQGFSGYLCELLVLKYSSFRGVLEGSQGWRRGVVIELDRPSGRAFDEPLVVVDPVDPNRNVASAVSLEQLAMFVHAAREYLREPRETFFFPRRFKPSSVPQLRALVKKRGSTPLAVSVRAPAVVDDVLYPQLRKAHRALRDHLDRNGFSVLDSRFEVVRSDAVFLYELSIASLPRADRHAGPPVWVRNAREFLEKWQRSPRRFAGPFLEGDRWTVDVARPSTEAAGLLRHTWRDLSLGKDLEKSAGRTLHVYSGSSAIRSGYTAAWSTLFDKRFPWDR